MNLPANYSTKQREAVPAYVASLDGNHATAVGSIEYSVMGVFHHLCHDIQAS